MTVVHLLDCGSQGLEHCIGIEDAAVLILEGVVIGTRQGMYGEHYFVRADASHRTREVRVAYVDCPSLRVEADGMGTWRDEIRNKSLPALAGCIDVDIGITSATNCLPVKRLKLRA